MHESAARHAPEPGLKSLFDSVRPMAGTVQAESFIDPEILARRMEEIEAAFADDIARVRPLLALMTGPDLEGYGARTAAVFRTWEQGDGGPSLPALAAVAIEAFGLDAGAVPVKALFLAAILAEYPNGLQYHGNVHYRKVLFHAIRLIATHNELSPDSGAPLDRHAMTLLLIAACVHDLGHQGGDNQRNGVYTPGYMEQQAVEIARPYLEALGLPKDDIGAIETMVFCTDITFFAGDNSPCIRMKKIFRHYYWNDKGEDVSLMTMGRLRRFEDNPALTLMAMILHEADIATSAGLSYDQTVLETINIMEERGVTTAGPKTVLSFLREQLGETMFTQAGRRLFGGVMADIIARAEKEQAAGRTTFYE